MTTGGAFLETTGAASFAFEAFTVAFSTATCEGVLETFGFELNLSISIFVPAPSAAPVSAFTTLLEVELVCFGLVTVGLATADGEVVIDLGVVVDVSEGVEVIFEVFGAVGAVEPEVIEPAPPLVTLGLLPTPLMTLLSGARLSAFA